MLRTHSYPTINGITHKKTTQDRKCKVEKKESLLSRKSEMMIIFLSLAGPRIRIINQ